MKLKFNLIRTFNTLGSYSIMLIASNGTTTDSTSQTITVNPSPSQAVIPTGPSSICTNSTSTSNYLTSGSTSALSYIWTLTPTTAGTISGSTTNAVVTWASSYYGTAYVKVKGTNTCGSGLNSDSIVINVGSTPVAASTPSGISAFPPLSGTDTLISLSSSISM